MDNGKLPTEQQLAFLISRKIGLEGIEPQPLLKKSVDNVINSMMEFIAEAITEDLENEVNLIFSEVGF